MNNAIYENIKIEVSECINVTECEFPIQHGAQNAAINVTNIGKILYEIYKKNETTTFTVLYFPVGSYYFNASIDLEFDKINHKRVHNIIFKGAGSNPHGTKLFFYNYPSDYNGVVDGYKNTKNWGPAKFPCISVSNTSKVGFEDFYVEQDKQMVDVNCKCYIEARSFGSGNMFDDKEEDCWSINHHSTFGFTGASDCWVSGCESKMTQSSHVDIGGNSSNITVKGCYFHEANQYGEGGSAYGVNIAGKVTNCLVENNIFEYLRHSILLQCEATYNVVAYNYVTNPHAYDFGDDYKFDKCPVKNTTHPRFFENGDILLHGQVCGYQVGAYRNLIEGNCVPNIRIDVVPHGENGIYNTFYRNWAFNGFSNQNPTLAMMIIRNIKEHEITTNFTQNIIGCNMLPVNLHDGEEGFFSGDKAARMANKMGELSYIKYWYETGGALNTKLYPKWQNLVDSEFPYSFYTKNAQQPDFWPTWDSWPFPINYKANPAQWRHETNQVAYRTVAAGYSHYEKMCGPCLFIGKKITQTPAFQNFFQSVDYIKSSCVFTTTEKVSFVAGDYIEMTDGFETAIGGEFETFLDPSLTCPPNGGNKSGYNMHAPIAENTKYIKYGTDTTAEVAETLAGIEKNKKEGKPYFSFSPNPSNGIIKLSYYFSAGETGIFEVFNNKGVKEFTCTLTGDASNSELSLNALDGIYFYRVYCGNEMLETGKMVVVK